MQETMPLGRNYMYNFGCRLSKGCYCMQEIMSLGRTYMYNSGCLLSKGYSCMQETMPLGRTHMYSFGKNAFERANDVCKNNASRWYLHVQFWKLPFKGLLLYL